MTHYLEDALEYSARGWCILPIAQVKKWKKPPYGLKWKPYQTRQPTEDELREWFQMPKLAGLAVLLGPVSGGLYCREFDDAVAYQHWASEHPELAKSLPTVRSKRGWHVYFHSPEKIHTKKYDDGELRGIGCYCILPPSVHQSGHVYSWIIPPPPGRPPEIDPIEAGLCQEWGCTDSTENTEKTELTEPPEATQDHIGNRSEVGRPRNVDVDALVSLALPTKAHQNHHLLFTLARAVKAEEKRLDRELTGPELDAVFAEWYRRAQPFLREVRPRDEYWLEFMAALDSVKYPLGEGVLNQAWERAKKLPLPSVALRFESQQIRQLIALCRELQRASAPHPFFLSCRMVQRLFALETHTTANHWLRGLASKRAGILREVEKGGPKGNRASRYMYLPPLDE